MPRVGLRNSLRAFTLIELSIVLVVIGLIIAGVVGGQALVRQAQLRKIISDFRTYDTAVTNFYSTYEQLPGDMNNASAYWSTVTNGNGNFKIESAHPNNNTESMYAWWHLSQAGMISGNYTGTGTLVAGLNMPAGPVRGSVWVFINSPLHSSPVVNQLSLGSFYWTASAPWDATLNGADAIAVDSKMDDGLADKGVIHAAWGFSSASGCTNADWNASAASYITPPTTAVNCRLFFILTKRY